MRVPLFTGFQIADLSLFEPYFERGILLRGVGRKQVLDSHIRWRDQHRLRMGQHVVAILPVVVPHACWSNASERHRLNKEVNIDHIYGTASKGELANEFINCALVSAEQKGRKRMWLFGDFPQCLVQRSE